MADHITIPLLNPLNIVDRERVLPEGYNFKHFDAWMSYEQILPYEQGKCYAQKWQNSDIIVCQFKASFDPINVKIFDSTGKEILSQQFQVVANLNGNYYLQTQISLNTLDEGYYYVVFYCGADPVQKILDAEIIHVKQYHPGTILLKYSNSFNNNIFWESVTEMMFRIDGVVKYDKPVSTRTIYTDQPGSAKTVKGSSARKFKLFMGNQVGMPDWYADKVDEIFDQTDVTIDGKGFSAAGGSEMNPNRIERYAWAQWNMDILETNNSREKRFESNGLQEDNVALSYTTTSKLFGPIDGDANDNTIQISEIT